MKQIDIIKTWSKKRCLIVDDIADIRASIKRWVVDYGCNQVDTAGNAEEAIDLCERHNYDLVLADYNLGQGKSGQQLLEELRFHKLVKNTALFVMITAEVNSHYVLHALEYQPDDYLNKPLSRESLRKRLELALLKNEAVLDIKSALDNRSPEKAILAAEKSLNEENEKFHTDIRRALGELYCEQEQWQKAHTLYSDASTKSPPLWSLLGLARSNIGLQKPEPAAQQLNQIIEDFPLCVEARDLLADLYEQNGDTFQRQEVLSKAVSLSPRSSKRQRSLGEASTQTGDHSQAVHAWRAALKHSKNTCQEIADDYLLLANSLNNLAAETPGGETKDLNKEAMGVIKTVEKKYPRHPVVQLRSSQLKADVFDIQGKTEEYKKELERSLELQGEFNYSALRNTSFNLCIDCARAFMDHGYFNEGEAFLEELAERTSDEKLSVQIDKLRREPQTKEGISFAASLNKRGIGFYEKGDYKQAQQAFEQVLKDLPNHTGLNLNLLQVLVTKGHQERLKEKDLHLLTICYRRVKHIRPRSTHWKRFEYLKQKCQALQQDDIPEGTFR